MGSYRKVGNDILKEWLDFREEELGSLTCKEDKVDATITFARLRGIQSGVKYAEGFRQCLTDHRIITKRLLP